MYSICWQGGEDSGGGGDYVNHTRFVWGTCPPLPLIAPCTHPHPPPLKKKKKIEGKRKHLQTRNDVVTVLLMKMKFS